MIQDIKKLKINKKSDEILVSLEDLDNQLEFYNKTLNQFEILNHDYALKLNNFQKTNNQLKKENENLKKEIKKLNDERGILKRETIKLNFPKVVDEDFKKGITVLVPTYKAERFVLKFLDSMQKQTLDYDLFEVLFVINGERDNTENLIKDFIKENPELNVTIIESEPGATTARNAGIDVLNREYVTFIDVDDFISPGYLEITYECAKPNRIVIGNYYDIDENTGELSETYFTNSLSKFKGLIDPYSIAQGALLIATNKVMPTKYIKTIKFNTDLKSGDDHEYFCRLYSQYDFEFYFVGNDCDAIYYRLVVSNSVSRQPTSFDFNIIQRLEVMKQIDILFDNLKNPKMEKLLDLTMNSSQMTFLGRYLEEYPEQYQKVLDKIKSYNLIHFNYNIFQNKVIAIFNKIINNDNEQLADFKKENDNLSSQIKLLTSSNLEYKDIVNLKNQNSDLLVNNKELADNILENNSKINYLEEQNEMLKNYIRQLSNSVHETNAMVLDFKIQNERLTKQNRKLLEMNEELLNSNSWKLTKPMRKIKGLRK